MLFTITDEYGNAVSCISNIRYNELLASINRVNVLFNNACSTDRDVMESAYELSNLFRGYVMYSQSHVNGRINVDDTLIKGSVQLESDVGNLKVTNFEFTALRELLSKKPNLSPVMQEMVICDIANINSRILQMMLCIIVQRDDLMHKSKKAVDSDIDAFNRKSEEHNYGFKIVDKSVGIDVVIRNA